MSAPNRARTARLGPAADDELAVLEELELAPLGAALARAIRRARVLHDQPFPSLGLCLLVQCPPIVRHLRREPDERRGGRMLGEQRLEHGAPLSQRAARRSSPSTRSRSKAMKAAGCCAGVSVGVRDW
jgi:hypothetical protein